MNSKHQLFSCYDIDLPDSILNTQNNSRILFHKVNNFPFVRWPNGRPCEVINIYLLSISRQITGDTLKTYASQLTHLVRFCANSNVSFFSLTDSHLIDLSRFLSNEKSRYNLNERVRNNNTIRMILGRCLVFLIWAQRNFLLSTDQRLIDERSKSPKIAVQFKSNHHGRKISTYVTHLSMPESVSKVPKRPIARSIIENIEEMIEKLSLLTNASEPTLRRYKSDPELYLAQSNYIRARRRFMIWILSRVGLRPSEMVSLELSDHINISNTLRLIIPTKKRRENISPKRVFPITLKDSQVFERYLIVRRKYGALLESKGITEIADSLFLTVNGEAIKKTSLEKDFTRLAKACGYENIQVCVSMFRHRFITYEVVAHLKEFMNGSGKTRQIMTDSDYRSILRRVATKTGHGCEDSLWHYIDLAWGELNVWGGIDAAIQRYHSADHLFSDLLDVDKSFPDISNQTGAEVLTIVTNRMAEILSSGKPHFKVP